MNDTNEMIDQLHVPCIITDKALNTQVGKLENLTNNIPGGVHQCHNDPNFTLISMSDSFFDMFGYTREEIKTLFDDKFMNMIYPSDRADILKKTHEQLKTSPNIELEYRVLCKNGNIIWILDKGRLLDDGNNGQCFYCLLIDITDRKNEQEELRLSLEKHKIIIDQTTDIIFEWDIRSNILEFSPNWRKKFGYDPIRENISNSIPFSKNIHPDDIFSFVKIMQDTAIGVPYSEAEFRIKDSNGRFLWCRIRATTQYNEYKQAIKAVGVIIDIDTEKKQNQMLLDQAQRDALTGLYNKATVNMLIEQRMHENNSSNMHALFIIDIDKFKIVNDTYGHLCGDSLLSDVAAVIKKHIRSSDIAGRIGGDEFLIYFPDIMDEKATMSKAESILSALQMLIPINGVAPITCSIGVVLCPHSSDDYLTLYKCADQALYYKKNNGRNGVTLYSEELCNKNASDRLLHSAVGTIIGSDDSNVVDEQLAQYVFRMLYESKDIESTLNLLLEIIGRSYDVSRAYIFESLEDDRYTSMTFEWCNNEAVPQIDVLQNFSYIEDLGDYQKNFNQDGIFYLHDIEDTNSELYTVLATQGIRSMLQCAILDEGKFVGGVGFDECRDNRSWSKKQIASFKLTASVLSTFLVKLRLKQKLKKLLDTKK